MNSTLIVVAACASLLLIGGLLVAVAVRRRFVRKAEGIAGDAGAQLRGQLVEHLERKARMDAGRPIGVRRDTGTDDGATTAAKDRVGRVAEAYASGEIDERMVGTAARMLGIDKKEALRRLENAGSVAGNVAAPERRPVDREKKRKKNKQAKRSRQTNRR